VHQVGGVAAVTGSGEMVINSDSSGQNYQRK